MTTWEDIQDGQLLDSITIEVLEAKQPSRRKRDWELTISDTAGNEFELIIWETHGIEINWDENCRYELENTRGKVWNDGQRRILHSTDRFTANKIDDEIRLLVIGDSHIGRSERSDYRGPDDHCTWQFVSAIDLAKYFDVDAVVHAGDIFDDQITDSQLNETREALESLTKFNITFHYILGNHETTRGINLLEEFQGVVTNHLDKQGANIRDQVEIIGIDQTSPTDF